MNDINKKDSIDEILRKLMVQRLLYKIDYKGNEYMYYDDDEKYFFAVSADGEAYYSKKLFKGWIRIK